MKRIVFPAALSFMIACTRGEEGASDTTRSSNAGAVHTVAGTKIPFPHAGPPGEWQMPAGDYSSSRYSELKEITAANAANLHAKMVELNEMKNLVRRVPSESEIERWIEESKSADRLVTH